MSVVFFLVLYYNFKIKDRLTGKGLVTHPIPRGQCIGSISFLKQSICSETVVAWTQTLRQFIRWRDDLYPDCAALPSGALLE